VIAVCLPLGRPFGTPLGIPFGIPVKNGVPTGPHRRRWEAR
jgi:hypothetical protein